MLTESVGKYSFSSLRGVGFPALLCTWEEGPNDDDDEFKIRNKDSALRNDLCTSTLSFCFVFFVNNFFCIIFLLILFA